MFLHANLDQEPLPLLTFHIFVTGLSGVKDSKVYCEPVVRLLVEQHGVNSRPELNE